MPRKHPADAGRAFAADPVPTAATSDSLRVLVVLGTLLAFASISTDLYLPALPTMAEALHADAGAVELTIAGYLVGFSAGQLLWGPIGDRYGRRGPIAIGLGLFIIGSAGCALSATVGQMIGWRVLQAVGACAGVVLARAMVRDLYARERAAQMLSTLMMVMAVAPLVGPILGGQILRFAGWQAIFWTLVAIGGATLAALFALPETLPPERRDAVPLTRAAVRYGELLRNPALLGYAGAGGFLYGGLFANIAGTPFAFISYHHVSPQVYGVLFALGIVGIMATNFVNSRAVARIGSDRLLRVGALGAASAGVVLSVTAWTGWGGLPGLVAPLTVFISATGFIVANSIAGALSSFPHRAGAVSALVGAVQYGSGMVGAALVGAFADGTPRPMGCVIGLCGIGSALCATLFVPASSVPRDAGPVDERASLPRDASSPANRSAL